MKLKNLIRVSGFLQAILICVTLGLALPHASDAATVAVSWTTSITNTSLVTDPLNSLNSPVGRADRSIIGDGGTARWSDFIDTVFYDDAALATVLGATVSALDVNTHSLIIAEVQGNTVPFESATITISDGVNSVIVPHDYGNPGVTPFLLGQDSFAAGGWNTFFGSDFGQIGSTTQGLGIVAFLLIDLSTLDFSSPSSITVDILGGTPASVNNTPDVIMVGLLSVPEPSRAMLVLLSMCGLALTRKRRGRKQGQAMA